MVCGKQPWGLFIEVTGNPQESEPHPAAGPQGRGAGGEAGRHCQLLPSGTLSLPFPREPPSLGESELQDQSQKEGGMGWGTQESCLEVDPLGRGLGGKRIGQARKGIPV